MTMNYILLWQKPCLCLYLQTHFLSCKTNLYSTNNKTTLKHYQPSYFVPSWFDSHLSSRVSSSPRLLSNQTNNKSANLTTHLIAVTPRSICEFSTLLNCVSDSGAWCQIRCEHILLRRWHLRTKRCVYTQFMNYSRQNLATETRMRIRRSQCRFFAIHSDIFANITRVWLPNFHLLCVYLCE